MRLRECLREARLRLEQVGIKESKIEVECMAARALGLSRTQLLSRLVDEVEMPKSFFEMMEQREQRTPLAYILGEREFFGLNFQVGPGVLIPRQDTETLVEAALSLLADGDHSAIDLGTGSGCIALALKEQRPAWRLEAWDVSPEALEFARGNASRLSLSVSFQLGDALTVSPVQKFDLLVSNPPYVETYAPLEPEVGMFEPSLALFAGEDGLNFYRAFLPKLENWVAEGGWALFEVGQGQAERVCTLRSDLTSRTWCDLSGIERVVGFRIGK